MTRVLTLAAVAALLAGCNAAPTADAADPRAIDQAVAQAEQQKQDAQARSTPKDGSPET